jgi:hypothetical protein
MADWAVVLFCLALGVIDLFGLAGRQRAAEFAPEPAPARTFAVQ